MAFARLQRWRGPDETVLIDAGGPTAVFDISDFRWVAGWAVGGTPALPDEGFVYRIRRRDFIAVDAPGYDFAAVTGVDNWGRISAVLDPGTGAFDEGGTGRVSLRCP